MTRTFVAAAVLWFLAGAPLSVSAQTGVLAHVDLGATSLSATESFAAVAGTDRPMHWGAGATWTIWNGLFVDATFSRIRVDGERVFLSAGEVYPLGIPLRVSMKPFDLAGGFRLTGRLSPYAGIGVTRVSYEETSQFAADGEDVRGTANGMVLLVGVDVAVVSWLHVGGEFRSRRVDGLLGSGGVSSAFSESALGGSATSFRVSFGR